MARVEVSARGLALAAGTSPSQRASCSDLPTATRRCRCGTSPDAGDAPQARERECRAMTRRPNVLVILTDQQQHPPPYESEELAAFRREHLAGVERLRQSGVSFRHHYPMAAACAPSRASLLTGHYPSLHGVTQTDGVGKSADGGDMFWLAPDTVPTLGDWFRAGGYRTYYKGKWHVSPPHLDAEDGDGYLLSIEDDGTRVDENIQ